MSYLLATIRFIGMALIITGYLVPIMLGVAFFGKDIAWAMRMRQRIAGSLVWFLGIKITQTGTPRNGNYLFISNHQSYVDPVVTACFVTFMPVAKAEVSKWPIIGFGAKVTGILFVKREDKTSRSDTRTSVREALKNGAPILIYPEGTTTKESKTLPFRAGTFQIAAEEGISVIPIAVRYTRQSDAWVGNDTFVPHFFRTFGHWTSPVFIHFCEPISSNDTDELVQQTQIAIDTALVSLH
jgi:lyso-ornithine lipid O-acyltransferase